MANIKIEHEELLTQTQHKLIEEIENRKILESELRAGNEELIKRTKELENSNNQLKEIQAQLIQSEKMAAIGLLAAGIAHAINNPIGFIKSNLSIIGDYIESLLSVTSQSDKLLAFLAKEGRTEEEKSKFVSELKSKIKSIEFDYLKKDIPAILNETAEGISRVTSIVEDLSGFSRASETDWEIYDLHKGLDSTINIANNEIKYNASVIKNFGEIPLIDCIPSQINQVILNVIINAAQSIDESGEITVVTKLKGDRVSISITDTGSGIEPDDLEHLFEPFFTTKPIGMGTGLGLSVSYGIVKAHGGDIEITSNLGTGTTVEILLPVSQHPAQIASQE